MDGELAELKQMIRSVVVSSPAPVKISNLCSDYRDLCGQPLPFSKFGYKDVLTLVKEKFADSFLFRGNPHDPELILIVPDHLKHIDRQVRSQKLSAKDKGIGRRTVLLQSNCSIPTRDKHQKSFDRSQTGNKSDNKISSKDVKKECFDISEKPENNINYNSTVVKQTSTRYAAAAKQTTQNTHSVQRPSIISEDEKLESDSHSYTTVQKKKEKEKNRETPNHVHSKQSTSHNNNQIGDNFFANEKDNIRRYKSVRDILNSNREEPHIRNSCDTENNYSEKNKNNYKLSNSSNSEGRTGRIFYGKSLNNSTLPNRKSNCHKDNIRRYKSDRDILNSTREEPHIRNSCDTEHDYSENNKNNYKLSNSSNSEGKTGRISNGKSLNNSTVPNRKSNCDKYYEDETKWKPIKTPHKGRSRVSGTCSSNGAKHDIMEKLREQMREIIFDYPLGIWCNDLEEVYEWRFRRELRWHHLGPSLVDVVQRLGVFHVARPYATGDWHFTDARLPPPALLHSRRAPSSPSVHRALPFIPFEPDVFPVDCMPLGSTLKPLGVHDVVSDTMLGVEVTHVYSPLNFWLMRLGPDHKDRMVAIMEEMQAYYSSGEGRSRQLSATAAMRVTHPVAALYEGYWHRAIVLQAAGPRITVRYVDYGTECAVDVTSLRPLLRRWGSLPAQAVRARLFFVRSPTAYWLRSPCNAFLERVKNRQLVANVVQIDSQENVLEVILVDTNTEKDVCINRELMQKQLAVADNPQPTISITRCV